MVITLLLILISFGIMDYWASVESAKRHLKNDFKNTSKYSKTIKR